jgi:lipopolysaccharide/colanic/teichoic acid biosynthesis glycosyltransferase
MMKRLFDIITSLLALILLLPVILIVSVLIISDSKGGAFFHQIRVGRHGREFKLHKFRTMRPAAESGGQLTVGMRDSRITKIGYTLRRYKLDELPQLWNILVGEMSVVGPRPEVPKYVALYSLEQRKVLNIRPGLTDYASIKYVNENEVLEKSDNPEKTYIEEIMPEKLQLNLKYLEDQNLFTDLKILFDTLKAIFR